MLGKKSRQGHSNRIPKNKRKSELQKKLIGKEVEKVEVDRKNLGRANSSKANASEESLKRLLKRKRKSASSSLSFSLFGLFRRPLGDTSKRLDRKLSKFVRLNMGRLLISAIALLIAIYIANTRADPLDDEYEPMSKKKTSSGEDEEGEFEGTTLEVSNTSPKLEPMAVRWQELSWKILCDEDEWRAQFSPVREALAQCLQFDKILMPEDIEAEEAKKKRDWALMFTDGPSNPYCRLSKNWLACHKVLKDINCIEPDYKALMDKKKGSSMVQSLGARLPNYPDHEEWIAMHRPYKLTCIMAKSASSALAFGLTGGGLFG